MDIVGFRSTLYAHSTHVNQNPSTALKWCKQCHLFLLILFDATTFPQKATKSNTNYKGSVLNQDSETAQTTFR